LWHNLQPQVLLHGRQQVGSPVTQKLPSCLNERFSSSAVLVLNDVDGFGQLAGLPGAAAEFTQDAPGLELRVGAFAGAA
jgi:hypothetical protein